MRDISYSEWMLPMRQQQISVVALLTAILYVIASILNSFLLSPKDLEIERFFHLYTVFPSLLLISYLAYTQKYPKLLMIIVMLAPIYAASGNLIIMYTINAPIIYLSEIFLIIFWIYTVSGLNFKEANISASLVIILTLAYLYVFNPYSYVDTSMSIFWMFAASSFGLMAAVLLKRYSHEIYDNFIKLDTLSKTDKLTGLYNRTFLDEDFKMRLHYTQKNNISLCAIMIDIDDFKEINDTYGHHIGDATLVNISSIIKKYSNENNIVLRWGGEEFLIIKINTDDNESKIMCENIRKDIESSIFPTIEKSSISIGYSLSKEMDTFELIINRADAALYTAKRKGKNRVERL